ncbi:MAG: hypothetical protein HY721_05900 [Planctomycetes bacterium]|nr:hypothetical protein [Planctomycetota bacterium]
MAVPPWKLLAIPLLAAAPWPLAAQEEEAEEPDDAAAASGAGEEPVDDEPAVDGSSGEEPSSSWARLLADPTLGGKLHWTYRASYTARLYDFDRYRYPFPEHVAPVDEAQRRLLEERHEDRSDQDLDQYFALRLESLPVLEGRSRVLQSAGGEASFRWFKDLDGSPAGEEAHGGFDRFAGRQAFQLQTLNARLEALNRHLELVLGRQHGREAEWVHFDGATATLRGLEVFWREVEVSGFAGSRVTFYPRASSSRDGVYGGHLKARLLEGLHLELSEVYYIDSSFEAELRQEIPDLGWLAVGYHQFNEHPHLISLEASLERREHALTVHLSYDGKLGGHGRDFNFDYTQSSSRRSDGDKDRYFNIGHLEPYDEVTLEARKGLLPWLGASAGGTVHRLRDRDEEDGYNTDWQEAWAGLDVTEPFWKGLTGRGTVRYVHTDLPRRRLRLDLEEVLSNGAPDFRLEDVTGDGEPSFLGLDLLVEQDFHRHVAVGATALLRSYEYQSNFAELDDLRAASLGAYVRWQATAWTQFLFGYSYDTDYRFVNPDLDALHTVRVQLVVRL